MRHFNVLALLALAGLLAGCRSAAPSARPGAPLAPDFLQAYVGQSRIVSGLSEAKGLNLDRRELGKARPACDVAVSVRQARFENGALRLRLEVLGRPRLGQTQAAVGRRSKCATLPREVGLGLTGFASGEDAAVLQAALDQVLRTPEAFLQANGVAFAPQAADDLKAVVASNDPTAPPERQGLWRKLLAQPKPLLSVDADFQALGKRARFEGEVQFRSVVGLHGRLRDVQILSSLASEQEDDVKRVLALWRFEPARSAQGSVPAALESRLILRID